MTSDRGEQPGGLRRDVHAAGIGTAHDCREAKQRLGRKAELLHDDIERAGIAAMAPEYPFDIERHRGKPLGDTFDLGRSDQQEHRAGIHEAADRPRNRQYDRPWAARALPRQYAPWLSSGGILDVVTTGKPVLHQSSNPCSSAPAGTPAWRNHAAAPSLSLAPFWQITMAERLAKAPAQAEGSACGRRIELGIRTGLLL